MSLNGKVALVTGGGSGIGRAAAHLLARRGAAVVLADRNRDAADAAANEIASEGGSASARAVDVSRSGEVRALIAETKGAHARIDILVHAAGICPRMPLLEMSDEDWREVIGVNLDSTFYLTRDVGKVMAEQRSGTMVLVASDRGVQGSVDYGHYAASKGGMIALMKSLAMTLGPFGVTVNALNPGLTDTPLARAANPQWGDKLSRDVLGRVSEPDEIAEIIAFLAGTAGSFMTGQIVGNRMRFGA